MNWLVLLTPLAAAVLILIGLHSCKRGSVFLSIAACFVSFLGALWIFNQPEGVTFPSLVWLDLPGLKVEMGAIGDPLARMMLLVVTGVGFLIHVFAYGYMKEDPGIARFFGKLSLFMFSMLGIVLANNLVMLFIFWELVGVSSYLLIGFWYQRPSAAEAAKKAFIVNRIGDFGFLLGILGVWALWGTVDILDLTAEVGRHPSPVAGCLITLTALGLFAGCVGKSAQLPLHVWLPDAMEGPTPVSALIHAATMVAAGVYMLCRLFFILELSPDALRCIAYVGIATAVFAAVIAVQQNDIKRILAYSTLSQLGYMVCAVGLGAPSSAMFHLTTHAFFKALLFLGAGSVIHAIHHEQDIWKMGGLKQRMPVTFWTFMLGTLALTGCPFLSGFYSKESILLMAYNADPFIFALGWLTAGLTAFYMGRLVFVAFFGKARTDVVSHAHESPWVMWLPLVILAGLSVVGGWHTHAVGIDHYLEVDHDLPGGGLVTALSVGIFLVAGFVAFVMYRHKEEDPISIQLLAQKFYIDEIYEKLFVKGQQLLARGVSTVDRWLIDGLLVRGSANLSHFSGEVLRLVQSGNVQAYVYVFVIGVAAVCYLLLF